MTRVWKISLPFIILAGATALAVAMYAVRPEALEAEIARTRAQGYAVDDEEFAPGIRCVARPIYDPEGRMIAALGVSGPSVRVDDARLAELGRLVVSVAVDDATGGAT